jgi:hypothetical protein
MMRHSFGVLIRKTVDPNGRQEVVEVADDMFFTEVLEIPIFILIPEADGGICSHFLCDVTDLSID